MAAIAESALGDFLVVDVFKTFTLSPRAGKERRRVLYDLKDLLAFKDALETCFHALFPLKEEELRGTDRRNYFKQTRLTAVKTQGSEGSGHD